MRHLAIIRMRRFEVLGHLGGKDIPLLIAEVAERGSWRDNLWL